MLAMAAKQSGNITAEFLGVIRMPIRNYHGNYLSTI
jgi:hypothetical protein